jgi:hypothetical protein
MFLAEQVETMNWALMAAYRRLGLTGSTPVIEIVALRILELAHAGEFDPDRLVEIVSSEFEEAGSQR